MITLAVWYILSTDSRLTGFGLLNRFAKSTNIRYLELIINNMLSQKGHIDWLVSKLGAACYAIRAIEPYMSQETIRMIYF
jgi:hypothetical protein